MRGVEGGVGGGVGGYKLPVGGGWTGGESGVTGGQTFKIKNRPSHHEILSSKQFQ